MESYLVCCLCSFRASSEFDLEFHIDTAHSDIFRTAINSPEIKTEHIPQVQASLQVRAPSSRSVSQVTPKADKENYQQLYYSDQSQEFCVEVQTQVTPEAEVLEEPGALGTKCPHCPYTNTRSKILAKHINKKHFDEQNLSNSLPPQSNGCEPVKNSRKRLSLPADLAASQFNNLPAAKKGKTHGSASFNNANKFPQLKEKYSCVPKNVQVVPQAQPSTELKVQSHSLEFLLPKNYSIERSGDSGINGHWQTKHSKVKENKFLGESEVKLTRKERKQFSKVKQASNNKSEVLKEEIAALKGELNKFKFQNRQLKAELETEKNKKETSSLLQTRNELYQAQSELQQQTEKNIQLEEELTDIKFRYDQLQDQSTDNIEKLSSELQDVLSNNSHYELKLKDANTRYELMEQDFNNISQNFSTMEINCNNQIRKIEEQTFDLARANDTIFELTQSVRSKIAAMSQMKLSEERLTFEVNKLKKQLSGYHIATSNSASFENIKSALETVYKNDDSFCKTTDGQDFNKLSNHEICQIVNHMLLDYIVSKNKHMHDLKQALSKLNILESDSIKNNFIFKDLANRINTLKAASSKKDKEIQSLSIKCSGLEKLESLKIPSLLASVKQKTNTIVDLNLEIKNRIAFESMLQMEIKKLRSSIGKADSKSLKTIKELKSRESEITNKISKLVDRQLTQDKLIAVLEKTNYILESKNKMGKNNPTPPASLNNKALEAEVAKLKGEITKQEKEYNAKVQMFLKNLDSMKKQVSDAMANQGSNLSTVNRQLQNKEVIFLRMRKELEAKSAWIKNLETILKKYNPNMKLSAYPIV